MARCLRDGRSNSLPVVSEPAPGRCTPLVIPLNILVTAGGIGLFFHWFGYSKSRP